MAKISRAITVDLNGAEKEFVDGMIRYTGMTPAQFTRVAVIREANRVYSIAVELSRKEKEKADASANNTSNTNGSPSSEAISSGVSADTQATNANADSVATA
jgi:hypothetical protein